MNIEIWSHLVQDGFTVEQDYTVCISKAELNFSMWYKLTHGKEGYDVAYLGTVNRNPEGVRVHYEDTGDAVGYIRRLIYWGR